MSEQDEMPGQEPQLGPTVGAAGPPEDETPQIPDALPILPTGEGVVFPFMILPLVARDEKSVQLVGDVARGNRMMGLFALKEPSAPDVPDNLQPVGTVATILRMLRAPDGSVQLIVRGLSRVRLEQVTQMDPYLIARISEVPDVVVETTEVTALQRNLLHLFRRVVELSPNLPDEAMGAAEEITDPGRLADFVASALNLTLEQKMAVLEEADVTARLRMVSELATRETEVLQLGSEIQSRIQSEMGNTQREYYLREQLKQIQRELGELTGEQTEVGELRERIDAANLPEAARKEADQELGRLERIPAASPEYGIIRTYLDWIISLPWQTYTKDNLDLAAARRILDEDHYDLEKIKERILEYLAVHKLRGEVKGPILCFVGPPGVGKTSLGQSIARALDRKFARISLGGVRDEAEIRGHRRTYIGAMPGRVIQALRRVETANPVFMLDEIDKVTAGFQGDPAAALLEVLDPAQNSAFSDHYLDIPFDLSKVLFVATANVLDTIPPPLRDRMEIIELTGYTEEEKLHIAQQYLVPRQQEDNGLKPGQLSLDDCALRRIIEDYTREAGVRSLERQIGTVARKAALSIAERGGGDVTVSEADVATYLGPSKFRREVIEEGNEVGVATGMAWTPVGGDILFVEASRMPGGGHLVITGQLGEVMQESARAAMTYVRAKAHDLGLADDFFAKQDFHIHVPAGAIPKDGPSAGVTMATALVSAVTGKKVNKTVSMTGEITLRGKVLPIGGVKEKVLAAHRAGVKTVILPKDNEQDVPDIPEEVRNEVRIVLAETVDQVLETALEEPPGGRSRRSKGSRGKNSDETLVAASRSGDRR